MAFCWRANDGSSLNANWISLRGYIPAFLRNPEDLAMCC